MVNGELQGSPDDQHENSSFQTSQRTVSHFERRCSIPRQELLLTRNLTVLCQIRGVQYVHAYIRTIRTYVHTYNTYIRQTNSSTCSQRGIFIWKVPQSNAHVLASLEHARSWQVVRGQRSLSGSSIITLRAF